MSQMMYASNELQQRALSAPGRSHSIADRRATDHVSAALYCAFDELDYPLLLLDAAARVNVSNRAARKYYLVDVGDSLWDSAAVSRASASGASLRKAILDACSRGLRSLVAIEEVGGSRDVAPMVAVVPLRVQPAGQSLALVVLQRPSLCTRLSLAGLARHHGATQTEAEVLIALCKGQTPEAIAESMGVALATVRSHLNALRSKFRVKGIRELLTRVARVPPLMDLF